MDITGITKRMQVLNYSGTKSCLHSIKFGTQDQLDFFDSM